MVGGAAEGGALYGDGPRGIGGGTAIPGIVEGDWAAAGGANAFTAGKAGFDETEDDRGGPAVGGEVTLGGAAGPFGGGGGGAAPLPTPRGGAPVGDAGLPCCTWFGKGELITPTAAGVPLRGVCFPNPSGRSFHAGRLVALVYVVTVAGDWLDARGGGGTELAAGGAPND